MNLSRTSTESDVPLSSLDSLSSSQFHSSSSVSIHPMECRVTNNQSQKSRPRLGPVYKGATITDADSRCNRCPSASSNVSQSNENDPNSTNVLLGARQITDNSRVGANSHTM
ncbi:hypothetical protein BDR03DRAFT_969746 [Suillus americanus]|nr:hypothetical protein BDR03DRAFT_969746 [Suillus americanus]